MIFTVLLIFSLVTIAIAALGFFFSWCKNRIFVCCYGIILLPTWIFVIVVGAIATLASVAAKDNIESECLKYKDRGLDVTLDSDTPSIKITLDIYDSLGVDKYMCSSECPCNAVATSGEWTSAYPEGRSVGSFPLVFVPLA